MPQENFFLCLDGSIGEDPCDNLIKRIFMLVGCCCKHHSGEIVEHLLLHCNVAFKLWILFGWWN